MTPDSAPSATAGTQPTIRELLATEGFPRYRLAGGSEALDRPVTTVITASDIRRLNEQPRGALVTFQRDRLRVEEPQADLSIRFAHGAGLAGIIVEAPGSASISMSTTRLADKLQIPLIVVEQVNSDLVAGLESFVSAPELTNARMTLAYLKQVTSDRMQREDPLPLLREALNAPAALMTSEGSIINGDRSILQGVPVDELIEILNRSGASTQLPCTDGSHILAHPALTPSPDQIELWYLIRLPRRSMTDAGAGMLTITALVFSAHSSHQALLTERKNREHALLLQELLDQGEGFEGSTIARASKLGWRLSGWHTGIHITAKAGTKTQIGPHVIRSLQEHLKSNGIPGDLVQRSDGWVTWATRELEPPAREVLVMTKGVRRALLQAGTANPGIHFSAGIGRCYLGTNAIQKTLLEARQACLLAQTSEATAAVEHIDALNVKGLMAGWYNSEPVRESARQLLAPLLEADPSGELIRTLRCYLDHESSVTATSLVLGLHRNTIMQRLAKIKAVLPFDLTRPDERLVAHLATRGTDISWDESVI